MKNLPNNNFKNGALTGCLVGATAGWLIATFPGWVDGSSDLHWWNIATAFGTVGAVIAALASVILDRWRRHQETREAAELVASATALPATLFLNELRRVSTFVLSQREGLTLDRNELIFWANHLRSALDRFGRPDVAALVVFDKSCAHQIVIAISQAEAGWAGLAQYALFLDQGLSRVEWQKNWSFVFVPLSGAAGLIERVLPTLQSVSQDAMFGRC